MIVPSPGRGLSESNWPSGVPAPLSETIVAELVTNAFKHAFVGDAAAGLVVVAYEAAVCMVFAPNGVFRTPI